MSLPNHRTLRLLILLFLTSTTAQSQTPFTFIVIGDIGEANEHHERIGRIMTDTIRRPTPDLLMFLGDNFYPRGLNDRDPEDRDTLVARVLRPYRDRQGRIGRLEPDAVHAVTGNHDYYTDAVD